MTTPKRARRAIAIAAIVLAFSAVAPPFAAAAGASAPRDVYSSGTNAPAASRDEARVKPPTKRSKKKKKVKTGLTAELRHAVLDLVVVAIVALGLFLISSGVRGPRGRRRRRALATRPPDQ